MWFLPIHRYSGWVLSILWFVLWWISYFALYTMRRYICLNKRESSFCYVFNLHKSHTKLWHICKQPSRQITIEYIYQNLWRMKFVAWLFMACGKIRSKSINAVKWNSCFWQILKGKLGIGNWLWFNRLFNLIVNQYNIVWVGHMSGFSYQPSINMVNLGFKYIRILSLATQPITLKALLIWWTKHSLSMVNVTVKWFLLSTRQTWPPSQLFRYLLGALFIRFYLYIYIYIGLHSFTTSKIGKLY